MKWLKRILISLLVLLMLIVSISFVLPKTTTIVRSTTINASPEVVFGLVNNIKTYDSWMTWNQMDPNWKVEMSQNTMGKGATYSWESEKSDVGKGSMTITESQPNALVASELNFEGMGISPCTFTITPEAGGSNISWKMTSDMSQSSFIQGIMGKWMSALGIMNKLVGSEFAKSLTNLKNLAETPSTATTTSPAPSNGLGTFTIEEKEFTPTIILSKMGKVNTLDEIGKALSAIYESIEDCATKNGLVTSGAPMASYKSQEAPYEFWGGIAIDKKPTNLCEGIQVRTLGTKHVVVCHFNGNYNQLVTGYNALENWMRDHGKIADGSSIEQYISNPSTAKPDAIQTDIIMPIK